MNSLWADFMVLCCGLIWVWWLVSDASNKCIWRTKDYPEIDENVHTLVCTRLFNGPPNDSNYWREIQTPFQSITKIGAITISMASPHIYINLHTAPHTPAYYTFCPDDLWPGGRVPCETRLHYGAKLKLNEENGYMLVKVSQYEFINSWNLQSFIDGCGQNFRCLSFTLTFQQ